MGHGWGNVTYLGLYGRGDKWYKEDGVYRNLNEQSILNNSSLKNSGMRAPGLNSVKRRAVRRNGGGLELRLDWGSMD